MHEGPSIHDRNFWRHHKISPTWRERHLTLIHMAAWMLLFLLFHAFPASFFSVPLTPAFQAPSQRSSRISPAVSYAADEVSQPRARLQTHNICLKLYRPISHMYPSAVNHWWFRRRHTIHENIATPSQVCMKISGLYKEKKVCRWIIFALFFYVFALGLSLIHTPGQYRRHSTSPAPRVRASQPEGLHSMTVMMMTMR